MRSILDKVVDALMIGLVTALDFGDLKRISEEEDSE